MAQEKKQNSIPAFALIVIVVAVLVGYLIYYLILGSGSNFEGGNHDNKPLAGNFLAIMFKGGSIVPWLIGILLIIITFAIERAITIMSASGKGSIEGFVRKVRDMLSNGRINDAIAECDKQRGSVANVIRSGLVKYEQVESEQGMDKEAKLAAIEKSLEEATSLELPMLSKNLVIMSTCASISTLVGLLGTVFWYDQGICRTCTCLARQMLSALQMVSPKRLSIQALVSLQQHWVSFPITYSQT